MSGHPAPAPTGAKASTPDVTTSNVVKIIILVFLIIVILLGVVRIKGNREKLAKDMPEKTETIKGGNNTPSLPSHYTEYHTLKKGQVTRVVIPSGYSYLLSGGGKMYYSQPQNVSEPQLRGDGKNHSAGPKVAYTDLSCYENQEITVVCEFNKIN